MTGNEGVDDAKEIGMDAAVVVVLSEPDGIFTFKEEQKLARKAFLFTPILTLFPTWLGNSLVTSDWST